MFTPCLIPLPSYRNYKFNTLEYSRVEIYNDSSVRLQLYYFFIHELSIVVPKYRYLRL